jgi:hypothetical protein
VGGAALRVPRWKSRALPARMKRPAVKGIVYERVTS